MVTAIWKDVEIDQHTTRNQFAEMIAGATEGYKASAGIKGILSLSGNAPVWPTIAKLLDNDERFGVEYRKNVVSNFAKGLKFHWPMCIRNCSRELTVA